MTRCLMSTQRVPNCLWDFTAVYALEVMCWTTQRLFSLHGRTPLEVVIGDTDDISEYTHYEFYQPVWYWDQTAFPEEKRKLGGWLGVSHRIGQALCYWILPPSGISIARTTVQPVTADELATSQLVDDLLLYDVAVT